MIKTDGIIKKFLLQKRRMIYIFIQHTFYIYLSTQQQKKEKRKSKKN